MASFSFTSEKPDQQLFTDVQNLNAFTDKQLAQFVTITLMFIGQDDSAQDRLARFSTDHGVNPKALNSTIRGVMFFFTACLKNNMAPRAVKEDLVLLGLAAEKAALLQECWKKHFASLSTSMIGKTLDVNRLVDMEWKFGVTASTDEVGQAGTCFLQLKLTVNTGTGTEDVLMELSLPQFYTFLQQMQKAKQQCQ